MNENMTDEQFETYNKLLQMVDQMIEELPEEKKAEYRDRRKDILLNQ